jgi:hypothetical protein
MKQFPILRGNKPTPGCPESIPWEMLTPHETQAVRNHQQTLKELASRGGLSVREALFVLTDRRWTWEDIKGADGPDDVDALNVAVGEWIAAPTRREGSR